MNEEQSVSASVLASFLEATSDYTGQGMPLHYAKALKWAGEKALNRQLNQKDKSALWQEVLDRKLVTLNDRGDITGLSAEGESMLRQVRQGAGNG